MTTRHIKRLLGIGSALTVIGGALVVSATADAATIPGAYEARLSTPTQAVTGQRSTFTVMFTNDSPPNSFDLLNHATVKLAAGFTAPTVPATVIDSGGQTWNVTISAGTVTLDASIGLLPGVGQVGVPVSAVAPTTPGTYTWPTTASGTLGSATASGSYTRVGNDPSVTVATGNGVICTGGNVCDTTYVGDESDTLARVVTEGSGSDTVLVYLTNPQYACAGGQNQGKQMTYTTQNLSRKVTGYMELDKHIVNAQSDNGAAHYDFCYQSKTPFTQYDGTPAAASGAFFIGLLPGCSTTGNVAPCLLKRNKTGSGDMFGSYLGHAGDPGGVWQFVPAPAGGGIST
ncbi:MAG: hypothetical protein QOE64_2328 [Frankiales bacterium]|jgi:hypothetical protein|nr:hypothetical protein [Frankiales bacterium]